MQRLAPGLGPWLVEPGKVVPLIKILGPLQTSPKLVAFPRARTLASPPDDLLKIATVRRAVIDVDRENPARKLDQIDSPLPIFAQDLLKAVQRRVKVGYCPVAVRLRPEEVTDPNFGHLAP